MVKIRQPLPSLCLLLVLLLSPASLAQVAAPAPTGTLQRFEFDAESLRGNLLGEPSVVQVIVYLPPGYADDLDRRYPVITLLHGIFDRPDVWVDHFKVPEILDRMIGDGRLPPVIVVFPEGRNRLGGGFYRDSPVSGDWGDFVARELVQRIDADFRTIPARGSRALAGHSMGGYGAIHAAMEHPDVYATVYAMSPCCLDVDEDLGQGNPVWKRIAALEDWEAVEKAARERDFYLVAGVGVLTAFLPNPAKPPFMVDLPFGAERGETVILEPDYSRFVAEFPMAQIAARRDALLSMKGIALDYGTSDQFAHIPAATRRFSARLAELRIPHMLDVYDGDHRKLIRRRLEEVVLPFVARHLEAP